MKTLYETLGGTYREENGRLIPEIKLPEQTNYQIGKYGQFYLDYIKNHRRGRNYIARYSISISKIVKISPRQLLNRTVVSAFWQRFRLL